MATLYSQQLLQTEQGESFNPLAGHEHGITRKLFFEFNTTDDLNGATLAEGDTVRLVRIPKGFRIIGGEYGFEAMGTDQTADLGLAGADDTGYIDAADTLADDVDYFVDGDDVSAAGTGSWTNTFAGVADQATLVTEKDVFLTVTLDDTSSADPWAADKDFNGYVEIVGIG